MSSRASSAPAPEPQEAGAFFDTRAAGYDRAYDGPAGYALRTRLATAVEIIGPGPGDALDAGMGPGRLLAALVQLGWTVSGVDASAEMVGAARRRLPGSASRLVQGRIESLPFPDASFDLVVATGVLEYAEIELALPELRRVLRHGGRAVLSYPNPRNMYGLWKTRVWYRFVRGGKRLAGRPAPAFLRGSSPLTPTEFHELLASAGLVPDHSEYTSFLVVPSPLDELFPRAAARACGVFEGRGPRLGRRVAGQVVYAARKPETDS